MNRGGTDATDETGATDRFSHERELRSPRAGMNFVNGLCQPLVTVPNRVPFTSLRPGRGGAKQARTVIDENRDPWSPWRVPAVFRCVRFTQPATVAA
jgi:hypothetical protein